MAYLKSLEYCKEELKTLEASTHRQYQLKAMQIHLSTLNFHLQALHFDEIYKEYKFHQFFTIQKH
jgi:hypothetical protein